MATDPAGSPENGAPDPAKSPAGGGEPANGPPPPITTIDLPSQPDLDRDPNAVGRTVSASSSTPGGKDGSREPPGAETAGSLIEEKSYKPDSRDATRQTITLWLIGLLCAIVVLTFVALFARGGAHGFTDPEFFRELKQVLDVILGPVVTLLASAIGYYFGYKQGELGAQARAPGRNG